MTRDETARLIRFAIVGVGVALWYIGAYLVLLAAGLAQPVANALAFASAVTGQYLLQAVWTFRRPLALPDQILRFAVAIGLGFVVSALITGVAGPRLGWPDGLSAAVVTVVLPVQNYILFRIWVFPTPDLTSEQ